MLEMKYVFHYGVFSNSLTLISGHAAGKDAQPAASSAVHEGIRLHSSPTASHGQSLRKESTRRRLHERSQDLDRYSWNVKFSHAQDNQS